MSERDIFKWVTVAPGVELQVRFNRRLVEAARNRDSGDRTASVTGEIINITMTLEAIDKAQGDY